MECHGEQRRALGRLPNPLEIRRGTQLLIGCDQRPAAVERSGRNEAISRIPMLICGAARENSDFRSDRQDTQAQSLKKTGEVFNGWDIIRKQKTTAFMKKGHLPKGNIGNGVNHVTQANAITKSVQPLACLLSGVALWLDAGDDPATASSAGTMRGFLTG